MAIGFEVEPVAKSKPSVTIRVDADSADAIKLAATLSGVGIMDYVRDVLAPIAKRDADKRMKQRLAKGDKPE